MLRQARELPKIDIGGTMFYLDLRMNEFRQVENFANRIDIDDHLLETANGFRVLFDLKTKGVFKGEAEEYYQRIGTDLIEINLPALEKMDPLGHTWKLEEDGWLTTEEARKKIANLLKKKPKLGDSLLPRRRRENKLRKKL